MSVPIVNPIRWQLIENRAMLLLDVKPVFYSSGGSMLRKSLILLVVG
jgi:hypothetical protein